MKLIWHRYLVLNLGICVHKTPTETSLTEITNMDRNPAQGLKNY